MKNNLQNEWLNNLKIGDEVLVVQYGLRKRYSRAIVTKITTRYRNLTVTFDNSSAIIFDSRGLEKRVGAGVYVKSLLIQPNEENLSEMRKLREEYELDEIAHYLYNNTTKLLHSEKLEILQSLKSIIERRRNEKSRN